MMPRLFSSLMVVALLGVSCFAECPGNQEKQDCGSCTWTCGDIPLSDRACTQECRVDACGCPEDLPVWDDGMCIKESECPQLDPCEGVDCDDGYTCSLYEVTCVRAPCPAVAVCESLAEILCATTSCLAGNVCKVDEVQCESAPCEPVAGCVDADICNLPQVVGSCEAAISSWYYDNQLEQCTPFDYGGCDGNENRFISKSACEIACKPYDPCQSVTCEPGYACESRDVQCVQAPCLPVAECVDLAEECDKLSCSEGQTCKLKEVQCVTTPCYPQPTCVDAEICDQPEEVRGSCSDWVTRWYYNTIDNNCQKFDYGGCGGNENNFLSKSDCEKSCQKENEPFCPVESPMKDSDGDPVCCGHCLETVQCPSTHFCHVHPTDYFAICCQRENLTLCQQTKLRNDDPELMDAPSIDCDEDGNFAKMQCDGFLGMCYCVTTEDGHIIPDSNVKDQTKLNCDADKFKIYYAEKYCLTELEQTKTILGGYVPSCDEFGLYEEKQCHKLGPEYGYCWCVTKDGTEVLDSRRNDNIDLDCSTVGSATRPQTMLAFLLGTMTLMLSIFY